VTVRCNGDPVEIEEGATVQALLARIGVEADARGIAVAVDGEVVPRGRWPETPLQSDAQVEVVTAIQGG
jgi:sulfur carrier protein